MSILIGVILAASIFMLIMKWWSEGAFEASEAFLLAVVFCGLVFGLCVSRTIWQSLLTAIPLAAAGGYAYYSYSFGSTRSYLKRRCMDYQRAIHTDPRNIGAREHLAEALYGMGELDRAIDEIQASVDIGGSVESRYRLAKWSKERHLRDTSNPVCRWCEVENALGERKCRSCGAELPYENALSRWLMGGKTGRIRYYLICVVGIALIGVSFRFLPMKYAFIPLGLCVVTLAGWSLVSSARS